MARDEERIDRIRQTLAASGADAVICSLPSNVLLLSGYWPVIGTATAVATKDGAIGVVAPEDEQEIAQRGWADPIETFRPGSLDRLTTAAEALREPLTKLLAGLGLQHAAISCDRGQNTEPATYSAMHLYGDTLPQLLHENAAITVVSDATELLARLRSVLTNQEIKQVRQACAIAGDAFAAGKQSLRPGVLEVEAANALRHWLGGGRVLRDPDRAGGFAWCMGGADSAQAKAAYARSRHQPLARQQLALVHCNSYLNGFWTDISRTYFLGDLDAKVKGIHEAVLAAREDALSAIRPGVAAGNVDAAARACLESRGFGRQQFPHSTGHGVGFGAIDPNALPRLHPESPDILEEGMVFNVEPAVYIQGYGGVRQCEMVAVTRNGAELLTDFDGQIEDLIIPIPA